VIALHWQAIQKRGVARSHAHNGVRVIGVGHYGRDEDLKGWQIFLRVQLASRMDVPPSRLAYFFRQNRPPLSFYLSFAKTSSAFSFQYLGKTGYNILTGVI
jgi:hypothetical protein